MTELVLFNAPQSTCSQRVRFVLQAKGLAFEERKLDLFAGDQLKPDYLKINPNGVVPSLLHDGRVVDRFLGHHGISRRGVSAAERLVPEDPVERAAMRALMRFIDEVPAAAIRVPSYNLAFLPAFQAMSEDEFRALAESKPLRKEFLLTMGRTGFSQCRDEKRDGPPRPLGPADGRCDPRERRAVHARSAAHARRHRHHAGDRAAPGHQSHRRCGTHHPAVGTWLDAIQAHPAYAKTYYVGSLLTEKYPHLRKQLSAAD